METSASLAGRIVHTSPRGWAVALLSRLQLSSVAVISFAFGIFLPFIRQDLQLSPGQAGLLQGVWWVTSALLTIPCSVVLSRFRPIPLVLTSLLLGLPFLVMQGLSRSFVALLLARLLFVLCHVVAAPARPLLLQQWIAPGQYALVQAVGLSLHSVLLAVAMSTSAWLIMVVGSWRLAYAILSGWFLLQAVLWMALARDRYAPVQDLQSALQEQADTPLQALWRYPQGWLLGITMCAMAATWTAVVTFLPTLLLEQRGIALTLSGPMLGFLYYALIPSALMGGWLAKKVSHRKLLLWVPALANVLLGIAIIYAAVPWLLMLCLTGLGVIWIASPIIEILPFEFPGIRPREVAVIGSLIRTLMGLGFAIGPMVTGLVAERTNSLQTGLLVLCLLTSIGVLAGVLYPGERETDGAPGAPSLHDHGGASGA